MNEYRDQHNRGRFAQNGGQNYGEQNPRTGYGAEYRGQRETNRQYESGYGYPSESRSDEQRNEWNTQRDQPYAAGEGGLYGQREQGYGQAQQSQYGRNLRGYGAQQGYSNEPSQAYNRASYDREQDAGQYGRGTMGMRGPSTSGYGQQRAQEGDNQNWGQRGMGDYLPQQGSQYGGSRTYGATGAYGADQQTYGVGSLGSGERQNRNPERRGPKGYSRSDDRIKEEVCDCFMQSGDIDPSEIEVAVKNGEVTLTGSVAQREDKFHAERLADSVLGVKDVHNTIRCSRSAGERSESGGMTESKRSGESESSRRSTATTATASSGSR